MVRGGVVGGAGGGGGGGGGGVLGGVRQLFVWVLVVALGGGLVGVYMGCM